MMLLHGEQYLELKKPIPTSGTLTNEVRVLDVLDKGKGCVLILAVTTKDAQGDVVCYNEYSNFIRGVSGVGTKGTVDRGAATAANVPPKRKPDLVITEKTSADQAALYR
jgi:multifunctional beta-oxidation protein